MRPFVKVLSLLVTCVAVLPLLSSASNYTGRSDTHADLRAELSAGGQKIAFVDASGRRALPSRMRVEDREVVLEVKDVGASYPLTVDPLIQQQRLQASDAAAGDQFGHTVSLDGDTAIIGAWQDGNAGGVQAGAAYVFTRSGDVWTQQQKLTTSNAAAGDSFGFSVAVDDDTALVGSIRDKNSNGQATGSAYIFTRSGGVWTQQQRLQPSDVALNDAFGYFVSLQGDTAVVTSVGDDDGGEQAGSAYVFTRSNGVWTQQQKIQASDRKASVNFGHSASLDGDSIIIGAWQDHNGLKNAIGAAYVFTRSNGVWSQQQKLTASDAGGLDFFGVSVSLSGDTVIVGAYGTDNGGDFAGSAYIFTRSNGVWTEQQRLQASDAAADDLFGHSVSMSGDTAVINAPINNTGAGAAYVFTRNGGVWTQQQKLTASDAAAFDGFGFSVSLSGDTILAGVYQDDNSGGADAGSAYIFVSTATNAAPVVNAGPNQTATEDVAFNLTAYFTDADASDNHTSTVNWGDGSPTEAANLLEPTGATPGTVNASHVYLAPGVYTINVNVIDGDDASDSNTLQVMVGQCSPTNVALLTAGATATASSTVNANFPASSAIDGERNGAGWGAGTGGWNDATRGAFPDALEINLGVTQLLNEIVVYTLRNDIGSANPPITETMTFTAYGIRDFEVQAWDGSAWQTVPNGSVASNNRVMRRFVFGSPITTDRIRVVVHSSADGLYSRIVEVEALSCAPAVVPTPTSMPTPTPACNIVNVASALNGAAAVASSTVNANFPASATINGDRKGTGWGTPAGGWNDATRASFPDTLEVTFAAPQVISEIAVYTLQNSFSSPLEPTDAMTFTAYGLTAFDVQAWDGSQWVTVPGGLVTNNNLVKRKFVFPDITTDRVRVVVHSSADGLYSRIVEIEAFSCISSPHATSTPAAP
jgi:hypothetical protein